jgi:hypothetical protein
VDSEAERTKCHCTLHSQCRGFIELVGDDSQEMTEAQIELVDHQPDQVDDEEMQDEHQGKKHCAEEGEEEDSTEESEEEDSPEESEEEEEKEEERSGLPQEEGAPGTVAPGPAKEGRSSEGMETDLQYQSEEVREAIDEGMVQPQVMGQQKENQVTALQLLEQMNMRVVPDGEFFLNKGNCFYDALLYSDQFTKQYFCGILDAQALQDEIITYALS